jgi:hypothetical protein
MAACVLSLTKRTDSSIYPMYFVPKLRISALVRLYLQDVNATCTQEHARVRTQRREQTRDLDIE